MARFKDRPTGELIVVFLTVTACIVIIIEVVAIVLAAFLKPEVDIGTLFGRITEVVQLVLALIAGYLAGSGARQEKSNPSSDEV